MSDTVSADADIPMLSKPDERNYYYPGDTCDDCSAEMRECANCHKTLCERCYDNHEC